MRSYNQGWRNDSARHSLARRGIKTGRKQKCCLLNPLMAKGDASHSRGFAFITTKDGRHISFDLVERGDGWYFADKKVAPLRNWMQAEQNANKLFDEIVKGYQERGEYKDSYSSMWFESNEGHTYSYEAAPKKLTPIKNYGTKPYTLGFEKHEGIRNDNGKFVFDTTYYDIQWTPEGKIFIEKSVYKHDDSGRSNEKLSEEVDISDKKKVFGLIGRFKKLYESEKVRK